MKAGVSTASLYPELLEKAFIGLLENGVTTLEVFINTHSELDKKYLQNLKRIADSYNAEICALHPFTCGIEPMMFFTEYEARFKDIMEYYKKYFEAMNILGAEIFVFHGNNLLNDYPDEKYFERFLSLSELGKNFGATVAQENVSRCSSGKLSFLKKMSLELKDNAKFVLDLKQARRVGKNPNEFIDVLGKKIVHIHYSDGNETDNCLKFGEGNFNNVLMFDKLKQMEYNGKIILELYRENFVDLKDISDNFKMLKKQIN